MSGKVDLTIGEIQATLKLMLDNLDSLSAEQRYSLMSSIEAFDFIKKIAPGISKVLKETRAIKSK